LSGFKELIDLLMSEPRLETNTRSISWSTQYNLFGLTHNRVHIHILGRLGICSYLNPVDGEKIRSLNIRSIEPRGAAISLRKPLNFVAVKASKHTPCTDENLY